MNNTQRLMTEYRKQFYLAYHKKVLPILKGFELKKKNYFSQIMIGEIVILLIIAILFATFGTFCTANWPLFVILGLIAMIALPCYLNSKFVKELKTYCLKPILDIFGNITWKQNVMDNSELNNSDLFSAFNRRSSDDGFEGEYKGVNFKIVETELGHESGSGKHRRYHQVFKGVVIKFDSNKPVRAKTLVATKGDRNIGRTSFLSIFLAISIFMLHAYSTGSKGIFIGSAIFCVFLVILNIYCTHRDKKNKLYLQQIHLEDPIFEKKFNAYTTDEIEGRYLITTAFMERFINLNTAFGSKRAKCAFYGDSIMFAISTHKNLFEIGNLFSKLENPKQIDEFFNEFASILLLVDHFKLDQKTGL